MKVYGSVDGGHNVGRRKCKEAMEMDDLPWLSPNGNRQKKDCVCAVVIYRCEKREYDYSIMCFLGSVE